MVLLYFIYTLPLILKVTARNEHVLAIYGNDQSKIIVKDTELKKTLKTFTVQASVTSGIAVAYKKDLLFFSDEDGTIYRIHSVDDQGNRTKSGKGVLFTNKDVDHFEMIFYSSGYPIIDLTYDKKQELLYIVTPMYIFSFDPDSDPDDDNKVSFISKYSTMSKYNSQHALVSDDFLYLADSSNIYSAVTKALGYAPHFKTFATLKSITTFAIDERSKKLYYFGMNALRVLDIDLKKSKTGNDHYNTSQSKVILANGAVTKAVHSMAVHRDVIVWSSCAWKKLYVCKLDHDQGFIPVHRVSVLASMHVDDDSTDDSCFHNINLFKHDYDA